MCHLSGGCTDLINITVLFGLALVELSILGTRVDGAFCQVCVGAPVSSK